MVPRQIAFCLAMIVCRHSLGSLGATTDGVSQAQQTCYMPADLTFYGRVNPNVLVVEAPLRSLDA